MTLPVFAIWISWTLNFIIKFNNAYASTLAILAALDSNLTARGPQIAASGPHVARHSAFSGPRKHSGQSSNLKYPPTRQSKR